MPLTQPPTLFDQHGKLIEPAVSHSIVAAPEPLQNGMMADRYGIISLVAGFATQVPKWGSHPTLRDAYLRNFLPSESYTGSAFGSVVAQFQQMGWKLEGGTRTAEICQDMLLNCNWGSGWRDFIGLWAMDYLTQDKGAFTELIRIEDRPDSAVINFRHLDAQFCWSTGNPQYPVLYLDRESGKFHKLKWYQVHHARQTPMSHPVYYGLQLSAMSRVLAMAQLFRNVIQYLEEKTGGRFNNAIHFVSGVSQQAITDAMLLQQANADQDQLTRFIAPTLVASLSPEAKVAVETVEFTTLPEGFSLEENAKWWLTALAMGLYTDYGEIAPLPGGGLGTASQSEVMDEKSQKKGTGLFRKDMEDLINRFVLPKNVEFSFDEQDLDEEKAAAEVRSFRAVARGQMVTNGEIDAAGARQLALDDGDIPQELFDLMNERDLTEGAIRDDERAKLFGELAGAGLSVPRAPVIQASGQVAGVVAPVEQGDKTGAKDLEPDDDRLEAEEEVAGSIGSVLREVRRRVNEQLRANE